MPDNYIAFLQISPLDSNVFAIIWKIESAGRIELYGVSSGTTTVYKKGYGDSDFSLVR